MIKECLNIALNNLGPSQKEYGSTPFYEALRIGLILNFSALLDGTIRLSIDDTPKKILNTYIIDAMGCTLGYLADDGNIYITSSVYSSYCGYVDKDLVFHNFTKQDNVLGIKLKEKQIIKRIKWLNFIVKIKSIFSIRNKHAKKSLFLCSQNIGHHIWNEQPVIDFIKTNNLLEYIDYFAYTVDFFNLKHFFNEQNIPSKIFSLKVNVTSDILIHFSTTIFTKETSDRLYKYAMKQYPAITSDKLTILLHQRLTLRSWKQQAEGLAFIVNKLCKKYDNIEFLIDGFSSPLNGQNYKANKYIKNDINYYKKWTKNILPEYKNKVKSIIGKNCLEKIHYYDKSKILIMAYGSGEQINWMTQKPIVLYGQKGPKQLSVTLSSNNIIKGFLINRFDIDQNKIINCSNNSYEMKPEDLLELIEQQL